MADSLASIAYEEARRALDKQEADVDALKGRATTILSVAAVVASLLGGKLLETHKLGAEGWIAVVFFALTSALTIFILLPRKWMFAQEIDVLLGAAASLPSGDDDGTVREAQLDRAETMRDARRANVCTLHQQTLAYTASCVLLFLQVLAWLIRLTA
jgi:hypothetical protein